MLVSSYRRLQSKLHPDRFASAQTSPRQKAIASALSSQVNLAYSTIKDPHSRAVYLLRLLGGIPYGEDEGGGGHSEEHRPPPSNPALLMEVLELREELEDLERMEGSSGEGGTSLPSSRVPRLRELSERTTSRLSSLQSRLSSAFAVSDWTEVKALLGEYSYFRNIQHKIHHLLPLT